MVTRLEEKRHSVRLKIQAPLRYQIRGRPEFNNVTSDNISLSGIGIINDNFIPPATEVMLEISILSQVLTPIGRFIWSSPLPHMNRYRAGLEFIEFDIQQRKHLSEYIKMQINRA